MKKLKKMVCSDIGSFVRAYMLHDEQHRFEKAMMQLFRIIPYDFGWQFPSANVYNAVLDEMGGNDETD